MKGIAKFTETLPKGFSATAIDNQGAKTMFDNGTIQYSWDSLPADNILNISFRVDVGGSSAAIRDTLVGKFFYIMDNQKLEADCLPSYINITGTTDADTKGPRVIDSIKTCQGGVFGVRRFPFAAVPPNSDAKVTIILHKTNVTGFAKVEDSLPPGFTAAVMDAAGASFTFVDNIAKFVWQNIPADSVITISYHLLAGSQVSGTHAMSGNFSYIYNSAPLSCSLGTTIFNTSVVSANNALAANNATQSSVQASPPRYPEDPSKGNMVTQKQDTMKSATGANKEPVAAASAGNKASGTNNNSLQPSSSSNSTPGIGSSPGGLNYRVQIMALRNPIDVSYFASKTNIKDPVNMELHGGLTKYTVGNFSDYKTVRDEREAIRNKGIVGPFVVSYNSGVRITVQEALMISHQKWYQ